MDYENLRFEVKEQCAHISLNRPKSGNALDAGLIQDFSQAMLRCDEDKGIRAVLLSGEGKTFCVGGDLTHFAAHIDNLPFHIKDIIIHLHNAITRMTRMEAPVVAAVHGNIAGAGVSLLCAADITLAAESTTFNMAYTAVGLSPDGSSTYFLPRAVGLKRALELMLSNRTISAQEALALGLVSEVVPDGALMARAGELAGRLAAGPTLALGAAKRLLRESWSRTLETQMEYEAQAIADMTRTADFREGVMAFLEKRPPKYTGE
ncbi:MAG: enoyl-CoA hydratase-related protein [Anaerolineae bacterium]|nr:enoyl-CoA hydratase-related protein [Anaerolineae bacterium]